MRELIESLVTDGSVSCLVDGFELVRELEVSGSEEVGGVVDGEFVSSGVLYSDDEFRLAHDYSRRIRERAVELFEVDPVGYSDVIKRSLLFDAPYDFDCALRYSEWDREPKNRFYPSRRKQLLPIVKALEDLEYRRIHRLLVAMPPGVGKTTLALMFLVWSGSRNPEKGILTGSHNISFLHGAYEEILRMLDPKGEYLWHEIFPGNRIVNTNAKDMRIDLNTGKRFETFQFGSIGSGLAGRVRATNLLYGDDLVSDSESASSVDQMDKLWRAYNTDFRQRMLGDAGELLIQTPWSLYDPYDRLKMMFEGDKDTRIIEMPVMDEDGNSNFDYPNGLGYTKEQIELQKKVMDEYMFAAIMMCRPMEKEGQLYPPDEFKRYFDLPEGEPDMVFAVADTKEQGDDYFSMPIAYKYGEDYYIERIVCSNGRPELIEQIAADALMNVNLARFESNRGGSTVAKNVQEKIKAQGGICKITTKWNQANKETRILSRSPWVKEHCIFKDPSRYTSEYRRAMEMMCSYSLKGKNRHDDVPDSFADLADYAEALTVKTVRVGKRVF